MCPIEPDVNATDYYQVLGVKSGAVDKDIGAAYKRLALKYHPDKNPDRREHAELMFKRVTKAYETLRDPAKRQAYDNAKNNRATGRCSGVPGDLGSLERADELYRKFFGGGLGGGSGSIPKIDVAGIFNFDQKPKAEPTKVRGERALPSHLMLAGTPVVIHGLTSKTDHNGKSGTVREWNAGKGRYEVMLNCGGALFLQPRNVTQLCHIKVTGHEEQPELNGKYGEIVDFNQETGCYVLLLSDPALVVELPPKNCILAVGTAAVLQGLSDEQLSGQMCSIVSVDLNASRYVVQCEGGRQLKVRFEKIRC